MTKSAQPNLDAKKDILVFLVLTVFCFLLFWPFTAKHGVHSADFKIHLLLSNYYTEYIGLNHEPPNLLHARIDNPRDTSYINSLFPAYYGHGMYTIAGVLGVLTGGGYGLLWTMALISAAGAITSYLTVYQAAKSRALAILSSALITFSIYNLQNVYTRGALNEYFAVQSLLAAICCLLLLRTSRHKYLCLTGATFFTILLATSHPITLLYGVILIIAVVLSVAKYYFTKASWKKDGLMVLLCLGLAAAAIAHFIYIYASIPEKTFVEKYFLSLYDLAKLYDQLHVRLSIMPYDPAVNMIGEFGIYHLNTQIAMGLLILIGVLAFLIARPSGGPKPPAAFWLKLGFFLAGAAALLYFSVGPPNSLENALFRHMQFKYRLVAYINLFLFCALVEVALRFNTLPGQLTARLKPLWVLGFIIVAANLFITYNDYRNQRPKSRELWEIANNFRTQLNRPDKDAYFYGKMDYAISHPKVLPSSALRLPITVVLFQHNYLKYGAIKPFRLDLAEPHLLTHNIYPHPWNKMIIRNLDTGELKTVPWEDFYTRIHSDLLRKGIIGYSHYILPAGRFVLEPLFDPPPAWLLLRKICPLVLLIMAGLNLLLLIGAFSNKNTEANS